MSLFWARPTKAYMSFLTQDNWFMLKFTAFLFQVPGQAIVLCAGHQYCHWRGPIKGKEEEPKGLVPLQSHLSLQQTDAGVKRFYRSSGSWLY